MFCTMGKTVLYWWLSILYIVGYVTELVGYGHDHTVTNLEMMNKMETVGISV